jgi:hypothetical protein
MRRRSGRRSKVPGSLADIDLEKVKRALFKHEGNVAAAAKTLGVDSIDLRRLCWAKYELVELALEMAHRIVDRAQARLIEALNGEHPERRLRAALFVLSHSAAARERGWCRGSSDIYAADPPPAPTVAIWAGDLPGYRPVSSAIPEARAAAAAAMTPVKEREKDMGTLNVVMAASRRG